MEKIIHSKSFTTPTGRKRRVEVRTDNYGWYRVVKWNIPKKKNSLIFASYDSGYNFSNKAKAIRKANSLARKK